MSNDQMLQEHKKTWQDFIKLACYSTVFVIVLLALMAFFLL